MAESSKNVCASAVGGVPEGRPLKIEKQLDGFRRFYHKADFRGQGRQMELEKWDTSTSYLGKVGWFISNTSLLWCNVCIETHFYWDATGISSFSHFNIVSFFSLSCNSFFPICYPFSKRNCRNSSPNQKYISILSLFSSLLLASFFSFLAHAFLFSLSYSRHPNEGSSLPLITPKFFAAEKEKIALIINLFHLSVPACIWIWCKAIDSALLPTCLGKPTTRQVL